MALVVMTRAFLLYKGALLKRQAKWYKEKSSGRMVAAFVWAIACRSINECHGLW